MCTNYTNLSRAFPKDTYLLPSIHRLANGLSKFQVLSFLDAYSRYKQIRMHPPDEEKMTFMTKDAKFCYRIMPFYLKNAGAIYQRLIDRVFKPKIKRNIEVYVDDIIDMSRSIAQHVTDLEEVFGKLHKYDMCLNPEKCTFWVGRGMFLDFMITH